MRSRVVLTTVVALAAPAGLRAQEAAAADFPLFPLEARAAGFGGAGSALTHGAFTALNPAAAAARELSFSFFAAPGDLKAVAAAAQTTLPGGFLGLQVRHFWVDDLIDRDLAAGAPELAGLGFSQSAVGVSLARAFGALSLGVEALALREEVLGASGSGWAANMGWQYARGPARLGISVLRLGRKDVGGGSARLSAGSARAPPWCPEPAVCAAGLSRSTSRRRPMFRGDSRPRAAPDTSWAKPFPCARATPA